MSVDPEIGKSVRANGIETNYLEAGHGPSVVLLHGSGPGVTAYANWRLVIPRLAGKFHVLAPDIAGFGYTERKAGASYGMEFWLGHVLGFLDAVGLEKASFVGNSFGGALALALAARAPERVGRMVLMGSAGVSFTLTPGLDYVWGYEPSKAAMRRCIEYLAFNHALISEDLVESRYRASIRPGFHESYSSMFPAPRQRHVERLALPNEALRALPHQALIIHGREDQVVPLETGLTLLRLIPRAELHVFGQCGHWTQIEKTAGFCRLVEGFLANP
jgi:pimeloyl-ACP methyl ester carboxylesterase